MKKFLILISSCLFAAVILISVLFWLSTSSLSSGGFNRVIAYRLMLGSARIDLGVNSYYLGDAVTTGVYLGNYTVDNLVLFVDSALRDTTRSYFNFSATEGFSDATLAMFDSAHVYFLDGLTPSVGRGVVGQHRLTEYHRPVIHFNQGIALSTGDYVVRFIDPIDHHQVLTKLPRARELNCQRFDLPYQREGIFDSDGMLLYSPATECLLYVYYYRNLFLCLDTTLALRYSGHTLDTTSRSNLQVASLDRATQTLVHQPRVVNRHSCVDGGYLYVHSLLMADNEDARVFSQVSVIDVYAIADGAYRYSFYVQDFQQQKITGMVKHGGSLYVLYGQHLIRYTLDFAYEEQLRSQLF